MLGDVLRFRVVENKSHRKSTSGILHALNSCPLCSRTQKTVSLSSCAAELHAIVSSASDGVYIRAVLEFALRLHRFTKCAPTCDKEIGKVRHLDGKLLWIQNRKDIKMV